MHGRGETPAQLAQFGKAVTDTMRRRRDGEPKEDGRKNQDALSRKRDVHLSSLDDTSTAVEDEDNQSQNLRAQLRELRQ